MDLIGKATISPMLFFSGKISGYLTWISFLLSFLDINMIDRKTVFGNNYISVALLAAGLIFVIFSLINLGKSTRLGLPSEDTVFKTNGLYKISRNPMYVGFNLVTIASMTYTLNIPIFILGLYSICIYHLIILGEEKFLSNRFGAEYTNYTKTARRYL